MNDSDESSYPERTCAKCEDRSARDGSELCGRCARQGRGYDGHDEGGEE